jgi:hypothetical protein
MKFLSDSEILNWNERLKSTNFMVSATYGTKHSFPLISFRQIGYDRSLTLTMDPYLDFQFSFSVAKNRVDFFWDIFENWYDDKVGNEVIYQDNSNNNKIYTIDVTDKIITKKLEVDHKILNKEYIKYTYNFKGKLSSIMAYVMFLEDTIEIFSKLYGYDEDGYEVNLSTFQIGQLVSKKDDKSKDYLLIDISPKKVGNQFYINYHISEVLTIGDIIRYGATQEVSESEISFSRNSRIDDILDN